MPRSMPLGALFLFAAVLTAQPQIGNASDDEKILLALHQQLLQSHLEADVDRWLDLEDDHYVSVNRGEIDHPTKAERRARRAPYLESTSFRSYRDLQEPIVEVSEDGTLGWVIVQVEIDGTVSSSDGAKEDWSAVYAWVELYRKTDGRWQMVGNVSNARPDAGD